MLFQKINLKGNLAAYWITAISQTAEQELIALYKGAVQRMLTKRGDANRCPRKNPELSLDPDRYLTLMLDHLRG